MLNFIWISQYITVICIITYMIYITICSWDVLHVEVTVFPRLYVYSLIEFTVQVLNIHVFAASTHSHLFLSMEIYNKNIRYKIKCSWCVSGITFIRYVQNRKIGKPNNIKCSEQRISVMLVHTTGSTWHRSCTNTLCM